MHEAFDCAHKLSLSLMVLELAEKRVTVSIGFCTYCDQSVDEGAFLIEISELCLQLRKLVLGRRDMELL